MSLSLLILFVWQAALTASIAADHWMPALFAAAIFLLGDWALARQSSVRYPIRLMQGAFTLLVGIVCALVLAAFGRTNLMWAVLAVNLAGLILLAFSTKERRL